MEPLSPTALDTILKVVQIAFYVIGATVAILTYRTAKRGLLNTVNTEYQKRVMDRLHKLSEDLHTEFDNPSEYFMKLRMFVIRAVEDVNENFSKDKAQILEWGEYLEGVREPPEFRRLQVMLDALISDPFVPPKVRAAVVDLLAKRLRVGWDALLSEIEIYGNQLARQEIEPATPNSNIMTTIYARVFNQMIKAGCGAEDIQMSIHRIRELIQQYFESFNPHRRPSPPWWPKKDLGSALELKRQIRKSTEASAD